MRPKSNDKRWTHLLICDGQIKERNARNARKRSQQNYHLLCPIVLHVQNAFMGELTLRIRNPHVNLPLIRHLDVQ